MLGGSVVGSAAVPGSASAAPGRARGRRNELEIVASHDHETNQHLFELSTDEIASGWTTLELENRTEHTHFVYSSKIPQPAIDDAEAEEMDLLEFWIETVTKPFQYFLDATFVPGKNPDGADNTDIYDTLFPPWFGDIEWYGGPGLTAGHRSSKATIRLDPGEYILECYVKDHVNDFHSYHGMIDLLSVTDDESDASEPRSTFDLRLSTDGIEVDTDVRPGQHVVGVLIEDQQVYANLVLHDAHLIRFDGSTDAAAVNGWMNWTDPTQLISDGTEPQTFVGGLMDIGPAGLPRTGYVHVNLKPGDYAWVAEVPSPDDKGFLTEFSVP